MRLLGNHWGKIEVRFLTHSIPLKSTKWRYRWMYTCGNEKGTLRYDTKGKNHKRKKMLIGSIKTVVP